MKDKGHYYIGIDVGSVSINTVVVSVAKEIIEEHYTRSKGQPLEKTRDILADILKRYPAERVKGISTTGSGGKLLAKLLGGNFTNEVISQAKAVEIFYPGVKTIIEVGGEDSKLLFIQKDKGSNYIKIDDFVMNSVCAAGTGSFLDQQASRLGFTIEEFSKIALKSERPPRIAGRCSVFAKSDMIHLQQIATPDYDIVAGLCFAVARNFKSTMGKGRKFLPPVSFQGGVAANSGVRRAFKEVLELEDDQFIVPKHYASMGAMGTALVTMEKNNACWSGGIDALEDYITAGAKKNGYKGLEPLRTPESHPSYNKSMPTLSPVRDRIKVFLGIDVGSVSTNLVLIDREKRLITKRYLMTAGRPIEAVRQGLEEIGEEMGDRVEVLGVGTTGSGRYLIGDLTGADIVRNEITAQAQAVAHIDSQVDTIFEIGGQDSKYISLKDGVVVDFEMNKVCAAGTGSFLEEQAERLGISIKGDFGDLALSCKRPAQMGERCTVFIESDLVHHQQKGAARNELVAGLSYSIVHNYLNRVVGNRRIGERIFFQGGTAANLGVVAAFEQVLGKPVTVPHNHDVTGAIGVAILAMEEKDPEVPTCFKGFDLSKKRYELSSLECKDCSNLCEIRKVTVEGEAPLYYGSRCEKYDVKGKGKKKDGIPDLFKEREKLLLTSYRPEASLPEDAPKIGLPRILYHYELYPFFNAFFTELGFRIVLSRTSNKKIIRNGVEKVISEVCFPMKVAHGHVQELVERGIKRIFLPSIIDLKATDTTCKTAYHCPYVQAIPYLVSTSFDFSSEGVEILSPVIFFNEKENDLLKTFVEFGKTLGKRKGEIKRAFYKAVKTQEGFRNGLVEMGRKVLDNLQPEDKAMVIVGRTYNTCDPGINLSLPQRLKDMGVIAIPFDLLPVEGKISKEIGEDMYWKSGQRILAVADMLRDNPQLYAIYITNFGCGPDSFIAHFFKDLSGGKPFLQIEIDEHSADAGIITRCEAFLDSLRNVGGNSNKIPERLKRRHVHNQLKKRIYLPYMSDGVYGLTAAFEACGVEADVIPEPDKESRKLGREYTCGRECYPCILTTGDMVKLLKSPDFDPKRSAFFMPSASGPCRFGQYNRYHRLILDEFGYHDIPIYAPDQDQQFYKELGVFDGNFPRLGWWGIVAIDLLEKLLRAIRPYEKNPGETDETYWKYLFKVCDVVRAKEFPEKVLKEAAEAFKSIPVENGERRPLIGVVGEIYVRSSRFSNENLVKEIEALGGEVMLPPIGEWILYTNYCSMIWNLKTRDYSNYLRTVVKNIFQKKDETRLFNALNGNIKMGHEPTTKDVVRMASPYLDISFEGEAILSIGKAIDYINNGVSGIINAMPFTCMPGTVVNTLLKRVREDNRDIPFLNMVYEGLEENNSTTRLEAFIYQTESYMEENCKNRKTLR